MQTHAARAAHVDFTGRRVTALHFLTRVGFAAGTVSGALIVPVGAQVALVGVW